jgi:hypothetical protein
LLAPFDDKELNMSFHDHLIRQEQEKRLAWAWPQAARHLSWFIRDYLRRTAARSALAIKHDLIRVDRVPLDRLTIYLDGETATITPLGLNDARSPLRGGCVVARSTIGVCYWLLWDGASAHVENHWRISREGDADASGIELDHLTVFLSETGARAVALSEATLDEALDRLFGLSERISAAAGTALEPDVVERRAAYRIVGVFGRTHRPYQYSAPIFLPRDDQKKVPHL